MDSGSSARVFEYFDDGAYAVLDCQREGATRLGASYFYPPLKGSPKAVHHLDEFRSNSPSKSSVLKFWDEVARELEALDVGAPSEQTINAVCEFSTQIPPSFPYPDVEHDDSSGSVSLRWHGVRSRRVFSINFVNKNEIVATLMPPEQGKQSLWRFQMSDERKISDLLTRADIVEIVGGEPAAMG